MPPKRKRTTEAEASSTAPVKVEPLKPGHTRAQGSRIVRDHNGDIVGGKPSPQPEETPQ